ncbi:Galactosylceramide sulfotransferase [Holothuria leucospilota]|uniref:Galactosylceramide sulfotransferase n=1 Tax=Holothuria leucospilota TaxID=206669 RepID=A0A9Q1CGS1_HOLLE|nr:Galactosylceramide sulfotransferase [Holothuria leucospilota]
MVTSEERQKASNSQRLEACKKSFWNRSVNVRLFFPTVVVTSVLVVLYTQLIHHQRLFPGPIAASPAVLKQEKVLLRDNPVSSSRSTSKVGQLTNASSASSLSQQSPILESSNTSAFHSSTKRRTTDKTTVTTLTKGNDVTTPTQSSSRFNTSCQPKGNVVFLKTHKTASTTLQAVMNRYGFFNNLSMVFMRNNKFNGHVRYSGLNFNSSRKLFLPTLRKINGSTLSFKGYNMSTGHIRLNKPVMDDFMAGNTKYITILRESSHQWVSAFQHLGLGNYMRKKFPNRSDAQVIEEFLEQPEIYRKKYAGVKAFFRNNQLYDLGYVVHEDIEGIRNAVKELDKIFDLVLISEYFDESMVLLKKLLCWDNKDVSFVSKNQVVHPIQISDTLRKKIQYYNLPDTLLYEYFNRSFWQKVKEYGPNFAKDVEEFRAFNNATRARCVSSAKAITTNGHVHLEYIPAKESDLFCQTFSEDHNKLFRRLFKRQYDLLPPK